MRQASGTQGPAQGNTQTGHQRRDSQSNSHDMNNHGSGASSRGGYGSGRGRGNFNNTGYNPQQMGYPPANNQYNRNQGQGRGGMGGNPMAPPFQNQGRPFPNSPHQAARSPALTPSMPGTPNMNQAMPNMGPQQYGGYGYQHMPQQQVNPQSSHYSHAQNSQNYQFNTFKKGGNKGNNKKRLPEKHSYQNSNQNRRGDARELFGHQIVPDHRYPSERESYARRDSIIMQSPPMVFSGVGSDMPKQQINGPPPEARTADVRRSSSDDSTAPTLPPIPPLLFPDQLKLDPKINDFSPASGNFEEYLTVRQQSYGYPPQQPYDPRAMQMGNQFMYPQMAYMGGPPPQSPQPGYQQPHQAYIPGQYAPQPMSRNSSQMSSDPRPASSMGQPQTPSMVPSVSHQQTPQQKVPSAQSAAFTRTVRKSAAIQIKRPDTGDVIDLDQIKVPASPAPSNRARTPPVIASTPTPPPKSATPQHNRTDSSAPTKTSDQIKAEIAEKVRKAAASDKADTEKLAAETKAKAEEAAKLAEEKKQAEEKAKAEAEAKAAQEAKDKEEADKKAAEAKAKQDEEDEMERQIAEMEALAAEEEKREAEMNEKRAAEKAAAAKKAEEERKKNAEEEDRKLKEQEREMERIEDEREAKRAAAEAKGDDKVDIKAQIKNAMKGETDKNAQPTPSALASSVANLSINESGTSTPASTESMGPPPSKAAGANKKVPAALNLAPINTKPVEAPQPSAALQSLKSARFLTAINPALYPASINSPNPALNSAVAAKGKSFKYDSAFLMQFQKVFTEKPSMEFESQIKALIGDGDAGSARSASTRGGGGMGPRSGSTRGGTAPGAFAMGSFGAPGGGKTLPPGTTSAERFAMTNGSMPRPAVNPMASFNRPGGAFPGGNAMTRNPSSSNMGYNMPSSPRQQSRSQRGGSKRETGHQGGGNPKSEAQAAKTMPLTAGMDLKPIKVSSTGWKPRSLAQTSATGAAGPTPGAAGGNGHMEPDMVQRKVKSNLNKMTPEKFDKIADQILAIAAQSKDEADGRTLRQVIQLTFEKATDEAHWASMYAKFCKRMLETMSPDIKDESILDKNGNIVSGGNLFRKYLLNRCQEEFERGWKLDLPDKPDGEPGDEKSAEATMLSDEYYVAAAAKRRGLGLVQFIGELYKLSMLTERIMHQCVQKLVDYTGIPDEAEIESLTKLLKTIGHNLDSTEKGKPMMDIYFQRIQGMVDTPDLPSRLRFMLMDIIDLRKKNWASKEQNKGPKTLDEVRVEVCPLFAAMYVNLLTCYSLKQRLQQRRLRMLVVLAEEAVVVAAVVACKWDAVTREISPTNMATNLQLITKRTLSEWMIFVA
jgi:translation initiation factor 4G